MEFSLKFLIALPISTFVPRKCSTLWYVYLCFCILLIYNISSSHAMCDMALKYAISFTVIFFSPYFYNNCFCIQLFWSCLWFFSCDSLRGSPVYQVMVQFVQSKGTVTSSHQWWKIEGLINVIEQVGGNLGADLQVMFSSWVSGDFCADPP